MLAVSIRNHLNYLNTNDSVLARKHLGIAIPFGLYLGTLGLANKKLLDNNYIVPLQNNLKKMIFRAGDFNFGNIYHGARA